MAEDNDKHKNNANEAATPKQLQRQMSVLRTITLANEVDKHMNNANETAKHQNNCK